MWQPRESSSLKEVLQELDIPWDDRLEQALRHSSFVREKGLPPEASNARMEFLGDAILGALIAEYLYQTRPAAAEGELTKTKAAVVSEGALAARARALGIGKLVKLGRGEDEGGCREQPSILAAALEAVIAAVYLSGGVEKARAFVTSVFLPALAAVQQQDHHGDFKSALQELTQELSRTLPRYHVREESGPPHNRTFVVEAIFRGNVIGVGEGRSKRSAEQAAAREALERADSWARS
ncbi:MAG: ribonuclease III [Armatimonadota bacterium]